MVPPTAQSDWQMSRVREECRDPWFVEELARARSGDESAYLKIYGSCLKIPLRIARAKWTADCKLSLEDLVRAGNLELMRTLKHFSGCYAPEFIRQVEQNVDLQLTFLLKPIHAAADVGI